MEGYLHGIIKRLKQSIRLKLDSFPEAHITVAIDII